MKYTQEVETIKRALEIPHNTYDLLLDSVVEKVLSKYEKALDKAIDELIEADGYILCGWNKARYTKDQWKEYLLKESEKE